MPSRSEQLASTLHRAVQTVLSRGLNDPRVRGLVSVTSVRVSPDGADAKVFISVHPRKHEELTLRALQHAAKHIRSQLGEHMQAHRLPNLHFQLDRAFQKQSETLQAIARIRQTEDLNLESGHEAETPTDAPDHDNQPSARDVQADSSKEHTP